MSAKTRCHDTANKGQGNIFSWASAIILLVVLFMPFLKGDQNIDCISCLFLASGLFSISMLWIAMADSPYSLKQVHWIFFTTFFAIAPLNQYLVGQWPWGYIASEAQIINAWGITCLWGVLFACVSGRVRCNPRSTDEKQGQISSTGRGQRFSQQFKVILVLGSLFCTVALIILVGISNLFLRTTAKIDAGSSSISLLAGVCLRAFIFFSFAIIAFDYRNSRRGFFELFISFCCLVICCFPTSLARFNVAAIYLGSAILITSVFNQKTGLFSFCIIVGFLLLYPLFDAFKNISAGYSAAEMLGVVERSLTYGYISGNYDAFSIIFWCFDYVRLNGLTHGSQLIGALLFFVPRELWVSKPVPSGQLVFSRLHYHFTDMSFALPYEGFINFGILGVVAFAVICGVLVKRIDNFYWEKEQPILMHPLSTITLFYPFLLSLYFYVLRGALMTTLTFVIGDLAVAALIAALSRLFDSTAGESFKSCSLGVSQ